MRLKVLKYLSWCDAHNCEICPGKTTKIDLMVNGDFKGMDPESLVGKILDCDYTYPYISIAMNVTEVTV